MKVERSCFIFLSCLSLTNAEGAQSKLRLRGSSWLSLVQAVVCVWLFLSSRSNAQPLPTPDVPLLDIEAPAELAAARMRLESFDTARLRRVMELVGLDDPGPSIRVVLASEGSPLARQVSSSTTGFAASEKNLIVLFPARSPSYPHDTLEDVLHHEVAHVLMARAAGGSQLPLWFHEGLAMMAERMWGLEDRARLLRELTLLSRTRLDEIDMLFAAEEGSRARAYTIAGAFVRDLIRQHGSEAPADILRHVAAGAPFERAFMEVTGHSVADAETAFWDRHRFWTAIGEFLTTQSGLWMVVTLIALYAIFRRQQKRAALHRRWEQEENGTDPHS